MRRLLSNELRKISSPGLFGVLVIASLIAPLLAVFTVQTTSLHDPRVIYNLETVVMQSFLDNYSLVAQFVISVASVFILHREYQDRTLGSLLVIPVAKSRLLTAKLITILALAVGYSVLSYFWTLGVSWTFGVHDWSAMIVVHGLFQMVFGSLLTTPCVVVALGAVVLTRSYFLSISFCLGAILTSLVLINSVELMSFSPWLSSVVLASDENSLRFLGLSNTDQVHACAVFTIFTAVATPSLYFLFDGASSE